MKTPDKRKSFKVSEEAHSIFVKYCDDNALNYRKFLEKIILEKCNSNI